MFNSELIEMAYTKFSGITGGTNYQSSTVISGNYKRNINCWVV